MAQEVQIQCVVQDTKKDEDRRIDYVGGIHGGSRWKLSIDDAIKGVESGTYAFFTMANNVKATVFVAKHPTSGRKYLTTSPDGRKANNLLSLPSCP